MTAQNAAVRREIKAEDQNWGTQFIERVLYPFATIAAPGFLLALMVWFTVQGFTDGVAAGVRSFAAVLLPLMTLTFLVKARRSTSTRIHYIPSWASFLAMLVLAATMMQLLSLSTSVPIVELVLSAAFSIITFMRTSHRHYVSYCLGTVLGALGYLVLLGVPSL